ncbi:MAG: hypothetical protein GY868_02825 [Deltaproteobacteria bacterium]|nr:hypothetical protein [Deltaproteobacteria bacterium]
MTDNSCPPVAPEELSDEAVKNMEAIIDAFKTEFGESCSFDDVPRPSDSSPEEQVKALISTFGLCVKHLMSDAALLERAKKIPQLESIAFTAEQLMQGEG